MSGVQQRPMAKVYIRAMRGEIGAKGSAPAICFSACLVEEGLNAWRAKEAMNAVERERGAGPRPTTTK